MGRIGHSKKIKELRSNQEHCSYCNGILTDDRTVDHFMPLFRGGSDDNNNKIICCYSCNQLKGSLTPREFLLLLEFRAKMSINWKAVTKAKAEKIIKNLLPLIGKPEKEEEEPWIEHFGTDFPLMDTPDFDWNSIGRDETFDWHRSLSDISLNKKKRTPHIITKKAEKESKRLPPVPQDTRPALIPKFENPIAERISFSEILERTTPNFHIDDEYKGIKQKWVVLMKKDGEWIPENRIYYGIKLATDFDLCFVPEKRMQATLIETEVI